ncbi:DUF1028 domain-containing protein [Pseudoprimorskyibacter insulae]|uniref:Uncharacterized protein n=1 Tax=Pseudoprimorskyibacter insulae TaxID=1695997 RepID=A0A2R8B0L8_9RHOB|nr:DUF1028 domain-containing protein [Pseudoprimorskyibacter insulae]SPF81780.1 hypothetical protein PRI8871_03605 [Pseudoprimorskyibacter insulae]
MTLSILTIDPKTGIMAAAAATGSLCVGGWVLRGDIESGLVASQGTAPSTFWRDDVLRGMFDGQSAADAVAAVTEADAGRGFRQLAALDRSGQTAAHTGADSIAYAGHIAEQNMVVAGNMLSGAEVLKAMATAANANHADPAQRMLAVLKAGNTAGGDNRGLRSAALLVLKPDEPPLDIRIDAADDPLTDLEQLWAKTQASPYHDWLTEVPVLIDKTRAP